MVQASKQLFPSWENTIFVLTLHCRPLLQSLPSTCSWTDSDDSCLLSGPLDGWVCRRLGPLGVACDLMERLYSRWVSQQRAELHAHVNDYSGCWGRALMCSKCVLRAEGAQQGQPPVTIKGCVRCSTLCVCCLINYLESIGDCFETCLHLCVIKRLMMV